MGARWRKMDLCLIFIALNLPFILCSMEERTEPLGPGAGSHAVRPQSVLESVSGTNHSET